MKVPVTFSLDAVLASKIAEIPDKNKVIGQLIEAYLKHSQPKQEPTIENELQEAGL